MKTIHFNRPQCIACSYCSDIAPVFWKVDEGDGKCNLIGAVEQKGIFKLEIFDDDQPLLETCVDACPAKCISIHLS